MTSSGLLFCVAVGFLGSLIGGFPLLPSGMRFAPYDEVSGQCVLQGENIMFTQKGGYGPIGETDIKFRFLCCDCSHEWGGAKCEDFGEAGASLDSLGKVCDNPFGTQMDDSSSDSASSDANDGPPPPPPPGHYGPPPPPSGPYGPPPPQFGKK